MGQIRASLMYANPKFDMIGVVDVNIDGAKSLAETYSALPFVSLTEAIQHFGVEGDNRIHGVVLCSPTFTHGPVIREAASHGLLLFVEKPIDENSEKIKALFEFCDSHGARLCCGFQRRFDDSYAAVANAVREGSIGKPISANIMFADHPCPPMEFLLTGGDIFMDLCVSFRFFLFCYLIFI